MYRRFLLTALLMSLAAPSLAAEKAVKGPLAEYVAKEDASFAWKKRREGTVGQGSYVELTLTSQTWRDVVWKHQLFLIKPKEMADDVNHGLLFITGGSWKAELEQPTNEPNLPREATLFAAIAEQLKTPIAVLLHVPHQPILGGRKEDAAIALTFSEYLETGDPTWPLLLPMVKSAVKGMDAVQQFAQQEWDLELKTFTVTGASKRGWTTWLTGAVDERATAIAPMVIDVLNMAKQMEHQKKAWGDFSYKIDDYTERGLQEKMQTEQGDALRGIVDPYNYRQWLAQPKLILIGTNDHYWPLDALNLYWNDMIGPKYVLYIPNNRHGLKDYSRIFGSLNALHQNAANGFKLPQMKWSFKENGKTLALHVSSDVAPQSVRAWVAVSESRDFRQSEWRSFETTKGDDGFQYELAVPENGCAALFGEAEFSNLSSPYYLSTNVNIVSAAGGE